MNQQEKAEKRNISVVKSEYLSSYSDERYIIVEPETDEILDDAQGYGYKSKKKRKQPLGYCLRYVAEREESLG